MDAQVPNSPSRNPTSQLPFWKRNHIQLLSVALVGGCGGYLSWIWASYHKSEQAYHLPVQITFGAVAAVVFVFIVLSDPDRRDIARICAFALAAGFGWYAVITNPAIIPQADPGIQPVPVPIADADSLA